MKRALAAAALAAALLVPAAAPPAQAVVLPPESTSARCTTGSMMAVRLNGLGLSRAFLERNVLHCAGRVTARFGNGQVTKRYDRRPGVKGPRYVYIRYSSSKASGVSVWMKWGPW